MPNLTRLRTATLHIDGAPVKVLVQRLPLEEAESFRVFLRDRLTQSEDRTLEGSEAARVREAIETYMSVAPGELSVDGAPIVTGAQLLEVIGESPSVVLRALLVIANLASPSSDEGKASASESGSVPSSGASVQAPDGPKPGPTAVSAGPAATAPAEGVTGETARPLSGPMGILN
jgi:hypothetical protein